MAILYIINAQVLYVHYIRVFHLCFAVLLTCTLVFVLLGCFNVFISVHSLTKKDGREFLWVACIISSSSSGHCTGSGLVYFSKIRLARLNHNKIA